MWHNVVFIERVCEREPVLTVKESDPFGLFAELLTHGVVLLDENPHRLLCVAPTESQLGQHVLRFCERF